MKDLSVKKQIESSIDSSDNIELDSEGNCKNTDVVKKEFQLDGFTVTIQARALKIPMANGEAY